MSRIAEDAKTLRQKLAELNETLETNNLLLEEAQALTHLGSWQWNVATGSIAWSDELYRIYGLKPQERSIGFEEFLDLIHPEDRQRIGSIINQAFEAKTPFEFEHRIVLPDKKIRTLHGKGKVVTDKSGNVVRMMGTAQDITERKKSDQALHLSDERFKAVTAATNDVVYDLGLQEGTLWCNEALCTSYGYPKKEIGKTHAWWLNHIHPEDKRRIKEAVDDFLKSKDSTWVREYRFKKHDGTYIEVRDRAYVLRDHDNKPVRMIGSILDITQQKELEQAKDNFISLVSHQLRTPLTSTRLLAEMLSSGYGGDLTIEQRDYIDKIEISTIRMIQLVSDILNVSQIERGRLKVMPVPTDVPALVKWHIDEVAPLTVERKTKIIYKPAPLPLISVDPILFGQILHNLLTNAIHYTVKPHAVIKVDFREDDSGYVLSVTDQGIGIPKSAQPRIFSSFFRADNAVRTHGEGTGLGLYVLKLIADDTGGKVWFDSKENSGTTFYLSLPKEGMKPKSGDKTLLQEVE